jgi:2-methylcitrate dehydratase PrpD
MKKKSITESLATFVVETSLDRLSEETLHSAKRCLMDWLGVALAGSEHESVSILLDFLGKDGAGECKVIGRNVRIDCLNGALVNAYMAHVLDYDDTHLYSFAHPSAPVWSPITALGETTPVTGKEALLAFVLGFEIETRIGIAMRPYLLERGWHMTAMVGGFGASAATGKLLRLNIEQQMHAFAVAATYASGLGEVLGSMSKALHPGKAAQAGFFAAMAAKRGFTGPREVFDAPRGFFSVNVGRIDFDEIILSGLGETFEINRNSFKPYPTGVVIHPSVDGILGIRHDQGIDSGDVGGIELEVHPMALDVTGKKDPRTGLEGKFSVYHCVAAALIDGACGLAQLTDERVRDPQICRMREKVTAKTNDSFSTGEAKVVVLLKDGRRVERHIPHASGTEQNPLSDKQLQMKYEQNCGLLLNEEDVDRLTRLIWGIDDSNGIAEILQMV